MPKIIDNFCDQGIGIGILDNFMNEKPIQELLKAIQILKKKYCGEVAIIGKVIGPLTLAYNLYGSQNILLDYVIEPEKTKVLLSQLLSVAISFAEAQFEAGADIITWADHATSDLISEKGYADLLFPLHKEANKRLKKSGPIILHVCGNVMDRLEHFKKTGFECFHLELRNNIKRAVEILGNRMQVTGGVNNPQTLIHGTRTEIKNEVESLIRDGIALVSPECAIPTRVPNQNLKILVETAHQYHLIS